MDDFTHFDTSGAARMVDVGGKEVSQRYARATGVVRMSSATADRIRTGNLAKGDVLLSATTLYGVTMQESGVSKRVSVQFDDVSEEGHISDEALAAADSSDDDGSERGAA